MSSPDPQDRVRSLLGRVPVGDAPVDAIVRADGARRRRRTARLAAAGVALAVAGVGVAALAVDRGPLDVETVTYPSPVDLAGAWRVTALYDDAGRAVPLGGLAAPVDLTFDPDAGSDAGGPVVSGHDGCNAFGGPYATDGDRVRVSSDELLSNAMGCERTVPLVARLGDVRSAVEGASGDVELLDADREVVVELEPVAARVDLTGTWQVSALRDRGEPVALRTGPEALTVELGEPDTEGEGLLRIGDGCNRLEGRFRIVGAAFSARRTRGIDEPLCPAFDTLASRLDDLDTAVSVDTDTVELLDTDGRLVARLVRNARTATADLDGSWRVTAAPGAEADVRPDRVTVEVDLVDGDGTAQVAGDCNGVGFGLDVRHEGSSVSLTPRAWRQPYCSAVVVAEELEKATTVRTAGEEVELLDADGDLVVRLAPVSR